MTVVQQKRCFLSSLSSIFLLLCGGILHSVNAGEFSLGMAGSLDFTPYNADRPEYSVFPMIDYDNDIWYISGTDIGWYLLKSEAHELELQASYKWKKYDSGDGSTHAMRRLSDRRDTLMTGISYQYIAPIGAVGINVLADTLNNSKGVNSTLSYLGHLRFQEFSLVPAVMLTYDNGQQNRYFYGISSGESYRSGLRSYRPKQSVTPKLGARLNYQVTPQWEGYLYNQIDFLPSTIRNSPMVKHDIDYGVTLGINYHFQ